MALTDRLANARRRFRETALRRAERTVGNALGRTVREHAHWQVGRAVGRLRPGTPVWEREWDVLCVLDACRLDLMCEAAATGEHGFLPAPDDVEALWSVGSQSAEWMDRTFAPAFREEMARTAYLTGNPFSAQGAEQITVLSEDALPLAADDFGLLYEAWRGEWRDGDISTIPPRPLTDAAIATWRARDDLGVDRVIVHYMQPHAPFRSRPEWFLGSADTTGWGRIEDDEPSATDDEDALAALAELDRDTLAALEAFDHDEEVRDPWMRVRDGELPFEEFWTAYRNNLSWVLDDVAVLCENCDARIVLTSDHGNAAGEFGVWSHPPGSPVPALRRVPWVELRGRDTGAHRPGLPDAALGRADDGSGGRDDDGEEDEDGGGDEDGATPPDDNVEQRLAALGYR